jgi:hypothetical protein
MPPLLGVRAGSDTHLVESQKPALLGDLLPQEKFTGLTLAQARILGGYRGSVIEQSSQTGHRAWRKCTRSTIRLVRSTAGQGLARWVPVGA